MKLAASIIILSLLAGCSTTVPVVAKFPDAPPELLKRCEDLKKVEEGKNSITDVLKVVVENYTMYYQCSNRVEGWHDWHKSQKEIFDSVGKK
jgi:hypothetical protein